MGPIPMQPSFELFDHTADIGLRIVAPTLTGLIPPATEGLYAAIGALAFCGPAETLRIEIPGEDAAGLLRDYLAELLRLFETSQRIISEPRAAEFTASQLRVAGVALRIDADATVYYREVKAVTYHELAIKEIAGGLEATVILDI